MPHGCSWIVVGSLQRFTCTNAKFRPGPSSSPWSHVALKVQTLLTVDLPIHFDSEPLEMFDVSVLCSSERLAGHVCCWLAGWSSLASFQQTRLHHGHHIVWDIHRRQSRTLQKQQHMHARVHTQPRPRQLLTSQLADEAVQIHPTPPQTASRYLCVRGIVMISHEAPWL